MPSIRVVVASDSPIIRTALAALLARVNDFEVAAEVRLSNLTGTPRKSSDVLLLEVPEAQVGRLGRTANSRHSEKLRAVVLVDSNPSTAYIRSLFTLGARAYVLKASETDDLYKAIRLAHRGSIFLDPQLGTPIASDLLHAHGYTSGNGFTQLSRREAQVIREVARGFTSKAIARKLGVSQKTIQTYRARIYEKLELGTRAEIVEYAIRNGLLHEMPAGDDGGQRLPRCRLRKELQPGTLSKRRST